MTTQKWILVIIFIFASAGVYLRYVNVSELIVPKLEDLVLRYRSLKKGAMSCQQKYLTLILFCLFAGWGEHHGKQGWFQAGEDVCGHSRKVALFEIVHRTDFRLQQEYTCFSIM
jgi:hypothetical protein